VSAPRHILVVAGRHEADGADGPLDGQIARWVAWGNRVTVLTAGKDGAADGQPANGRLTVHRVGQRLPACRAAWANFRGVGRDADVVLESGAFLTPLWAWLPAPTALTAAGSRANLRLPRRLLYTDVPTVPAAPPEPDLDAAAQGTLAVMDEAIAAPRARLREVFMRSESGKAAGLAAATLANNAIQLVFTVIFTRLLGATDYGTLAALISAFLILMVTGQSVQMAAAREAALDRLGHPELLRATLRAWTQRLLVALVAVAAASVLLRDQLAALIGVDDVPWAAAIIPPMGGLWMLLCLQRGTLQGIRRYRPVALSIVAEAAGRLICALALVGLGLGVTGALLGAPLAFALVALWLARELHRRVGTGREAHGPLRTLRSLVGDGWVPIVGLLLLASLQNIDVILAKHQLDGDDAGSYAAAAVAAKTIMWVAIGIGLHLLPEATRRAAAGLDPRPVLLRALTILAIVAAPALLVFAVAPELLLRVAFGPDLTQSANALLLLGAAMTLLAVAYLTVQYMVALHEMRFLWVLGAIAVAEPFLLTAAGDGIVGFAAIVFGVQCVAASAMLGLGLARQRQRAATG
jgi:O-antigen/teichoic acid export membrane protein